MFVHYRKHILRLLQMDLSCPPSLFLQIFAAFLLTNIQKWLIEIVNIDLDEKVSLKDGF